jgi:NAD+ kinase
MENEKKSIAIVYRMHTNAAVKLAHSLSQWLEKRGHKVYTAPEQTLIRGTVLATKLNLSKVNLVIALGGDGTYLRAVRLLGGEKIPILGVNLGSLGFLTPTRAEELYKAVEQTLQNKMDLNPRSMIEVDYRIKGKSKQLAALNDVVVERGSLSQLINVGIHYNRLLVSEVKADGIIVSSPTGSTAYNLSAGGPILHPEVQAFVITPIAPHSLTSRPLITPDAGKIRLKLVGKLQKAHLVVDGQKVAEIQTGDEVTIKRAKGNHLMVNDPEHSYFHLLREKLKFGDRP